MHNLPISITLPLFQVNAILAALSEGKFKDVSQIIGTIQQQAEAAVKQAEEKAKQQIAAEAQRAQEEAPTEAA